VKALDILEGPSLALSSTFPSLEDAPKSGDASGPDAVSFSFSSTSLPLSDSAVFDKSE